MFKHLATHPEHQAQSRANPALLDSAVEELARAYAPVTVHRLCVKPYEASNGCKSFPAIAFCCPRLSPPVIQRLIQMRNKVVLDRQPVHITFAYGIHRCLGSHLARRDYVSHWTLS